MVLKRHFTEGGEGEGEAGSGFSGRDSKRRSALSYARILRNVSGTSIQDIIRVLEPSIRILVRDAVQEAFTNSYSSPSFMHQISSCGSRTLQLHFEDQLPSMIFTGCRVESEECSPLRIVLRDSASGRIITSGPLSSAKVNILVLDGDFSADDREDWGEQEFANKSVREREGKRPLLTGTLSIALREGVGYMEDVTFTDNSSWIRCGKFRLGAKLQNFTGEASVREGISNAFKVKDHRGESYKKHHPPAMNDEVWRLEKIAKDGASHKRLAKHIIYTVKEFLRLYVTNPHHLRNILGGKISNKAWDTIIKHAAECHLDRDELYLYKAGAGVELVLDSIYQIVGGTFDGQNYQTHIAFTPYQKHLVDSLKLRVYENLDQLVLISGQPFSASHLMLSSVQANSDSSRSSSVQNVDFPVENDEIELHTSGEQMMVLPTPTYAYGVQSGNQFQISAAETSHQMQDLSSMMANGFAIGDDSCAAAGEHGWDPTINLGPLGLNNSTANFNENFQIDTPAWHGNNIFMTQTNQAALGVISSNFGIHLSGTGKSKAGWCKIRAVIKWRMVKSSCQKNCKSSKYSF